MVVLDVVKLTYFRIVDRRDREPSMIDQNLASN
jgi:hypothetical protein